MPERQQNESVVTSEPRLRHQNQPLDDGIARIYFVEIAKLLLDADAAAAWDQCDNSGHPHDIRERRYFGVEDGDNDEDKELDALRSRLWAHREWVGGDGHSQFVLSVLQAARMVANRSLTDLLKELCQAIAWRNMSLGQWGVRGELLLSARLVAGVLKAHSATMPQSSGGEDDASESSAMKASHYAHSTDFRSVRWCGEEFPFSKQQAAIVKKLWEAWENHTPDVGFDTLLEAADVKTSRLIDSFRDHPAWGRMIIDGKTRSTKRIAGNPPQS